MFKFIKRLIGVQTFKDGSKISIHSRESWLYVKGDLSLEILFYFVHDECEVYLPSPIESTLRIDLTAKLKQFLEERGYKYSIL